MRSALRWIFLAVAMGLLAWAVASRWDDVRDALTDLSWGAVALAFGACLVGLGLNTMSWRAVMRAIGLDASVPEALRVFLLSQAGKYVPGSVWPVLAQAEFSRDHGVSRARALTGSIVAMAVGAVTAAVVGAVGLVLAVPGALAAYWWVLVAAAAAAALLVPPVLARVVALVFRVTRRAEEPARIGGGPLLASAAWSTAMWVLLGVHAWVLLRELTDAATLLVATGAFALAWLVGFLVVPLPAGAGAREAALVLALAPVATPAQALGLALVSRFVMTAADAAGVLLGLALGVSGRRSRSAARLPDSTDP